MCGGAVLDYIDAYNSGGGASGLSDSSVSEMMAGGGSLLLPVVWPNPSSPGDKGLRMFSRRWSCSCSLALTVLCRTRIQPSG